MQNKKQCTIQVDILEARTYKVNPDHEGKSFSVAVALRGDSSQIHKTDPVKHGVNVKFGKSFKFTFTDTSNEFIDFYVLEKGENAKNQTENYVKICDLYLQQGVSKEQWLRLHDAAFGYLKLRYTAINFSHSSPKFEGATGKVPNNADVYVIGGGFAGVQLAESLRKQGVNVYLLEAQSSLGGRTKAVKLNIEGGHTIFMDAGGQYIGYDQNQLFSYITKIYKTQLEHKLVDTYETSTFANGKKINSLGVEVINGKSYTYAIENWLKMQGIPSTWLEGENLLTKFLPLGLMLARMLSIERLIDVEDPLGLKGQLKDQRIIDLCRKLEKMSFGDFIKGEKYLEGDTADIMRFSVIAPFSLEVEEISALYWWWYCKKNAGYVQVINDQEFGPQQYFIEGSMEEVIKLIAQDLFKEKRIYFNKVVKSIDAKNGAVITLEDGQVLTGKYAVVAMTPRAAGSIKYLSNISDARKLYMKQPIGKTLKGFLVYDKPWWKNPSDPDKSYYGYVGCTGRSLEYTKDDISITWCMDNSIVNERDNHPPLYILMCFITRDDVDRLIDQAKKSGDPDNYIKKLMINHVAYYFRDPDTKEPRQKEAEKVKGFNWGAWNGQTPYVFGGPNTFIKPGDFAKIYPCFQNKPEGNLFFAGAEYASVWNGYISGAIGNGIETANEILPLLKKDKIEYDDYNSPFNLKDKRGIYAREFVYQKPTDKDWEYYQLIEEATKYDPNVKVDAQVFYSKQDFEEINLPIEIVEGIKEMMNAFLSQPQDDQSGDLNVDALIVPLIAELQRMVKQLGCTSILSILGPFGEAIKTDEKLQQLIGELAQAFSGLL